MAEWIDLPSDSWLDSKLLNDPIVTNHHVVDHVVVCGTGLIMHGPTSVDQLKLTIFDEFLDSVLHGVILIVPPHFEELHLDLRELSLWVVDERPHDIGELNLDVGPLSVSIGSIEVLLDGLQPPNVIMGVRHNMDIDFATILLVVLFSENSRSVDVMLALVHGKLLRELFQVASSPFMSSCSGESCYGEGNLGLHINFIIIMDKIVSPLKSCLKLIQLRIIK